MEASRVFNDAQYRSVYLSLSLSVSSHAHASETNFNGMYLDDIAMGPYHSAVCEHPTAVCLLRKMEKAVRLEGNFNFYIQYFNYPDHEYT